jgi:origin recognition complex subunit 1
VTVCLVDEMDYLISRNFDVMYHFYSWPQHAGARFLLIGIANTMDLPERLSAR